MGTLNWGCNVQTSKLIDIGRERGNKINESPTTSHCPKILQDNREFLVLYSLTGGSILGPVWSFGSIKLANVSIHTTSDIIVYGGKIVLDHVAHLLLVHKKFRNFYFF